MSKQIILIVLLSFAASLFASTAFAQEQTCADLGQGAGTACGVFTSTTTSTTLVTVGGIVLTVVLIVNSSKKKRALRMYFNNNSVALSRDASMGGGKTLDDLRAFFAIPDERKRSFALWMRKNRQLIVRLTDATQDDAFDGFIAQVDATFGS